MPFTLLCRHRQEIFGESKLALHCPFDSLPKRFVTRWFTVSVVLLENRFLFDRGKEIFVENACHLSSWNTYKYFYSTNVALTAHHSLQMQTVLGRTLPAMCANWQANVTGPR